MNILVWFIYVLMVFTVRLLAEEMAARLAQAQSKLMQPNAVPKVCRQTVSCYSSEFTIFFRMNQLLVTRAKLCIPLCGVCWKSNGFIDLHFTYVFGSIVMETEHVYLVPVRK